jgi:hypothetical protein
MATARAKDAVEKVLSERKQAISLAEPGRARQCEKAS